MTNERTEADEILSRGEIIGHITALAYNTKKLGDVLGEIKPNDFKNIVLIHQLVERMKEHADELLNEATK